MSNTNTQTKSITLSLKELNYVLPNMEVIKKLENNANKILQININGDIVDVQVEVSKPVVKATKTTTTVKKTTTKTTAKKTASTATTTANKTTTTKTTKTRTTSKKKS